MDDEYCDSHALAEYVGGGFTVWCHFPPGHGGLHESPDYMWIDNNPIATLKRRDNAHNV